MDYNANSIKQLTFREGCRERIGIYLGSADNEGVLAGLLELVNNATDEAIVCKTATEIELHIAKDWASCRDYGRGMPHGSNSFTKEVMINLLTENHSGAKFDDTAYGGKSRGLNGTGSAATCCSSDWFEISSYRDGFEWFMRFEKGIPQFTECQKKEMGNHKQGTYIKYKPSQEVFKAETICFNYNYICDKIKEYSYFNKGINFIVINEETGEKQNFLSKNGLLDFAKDHIKNPIHPTPLYLKTTENDIDLELILQWTLEKEKFYLFSNGGENPNGGTPIAGIKTALTNFFKKNLDKNINAELARNGLVYICSVNLKNPIYNGQTKDKITNPELRGLTQRATNQLLNEFSQTPEFKKLLDLIIKENRAEQAAEKAKAAILRSNKDIENTVKRKVFASDKLKDARKLGQSATLYIVEGDSALNSMAQGRDVNSDGLLAIRGKIVNALSNPLDKVMENEEVKLICSALGVTPNNYKAGKLRYGRVVFATDADSDGSHICLLLLSLVNTLFPEMLNEHRIFRLDAPTHLIKTKQGKTFYYYGADDFKKNHTAGDVVLLKGLGELSADQVRDSLFGKNQRLTSFNWTVDADILLNQLMGEDSDFRRDYLFEKVDFTTIAE